MIVLSFIFALCCLVWREYLRERRACRMPVNCVEGQAESAVGLMSLTKQGEKLICSKHGEIHYPAWVPCWNGCDEGYFDAYEDDPLWYDEGDMEVCDVCHSKGGWKVCGECNRNNPDAEF